VEFLTLDCVAAIQRSFDCPFPLRVPRIIISWIASPQSSASVASMFIACGESAHEEYYTTVLTPQGRARTRIASPQSSGSIVNINVRKCHPDCVVAIHCLCSVNANLCGNSDTFWTPHRFMPRCINWIAMPQSGASIPLLRY
jgi:hypothetical protein